VLFARVNSLAHFLFEIMLIDSINSDKSAAHVGEESSDNLTTNPEQQDVCISNEPDSLSNHIMVRQLFS